MKLPFLLEHAIRDEHGLPRGETVNLYPERAPTSLNSQVTLNPFPGHTQFSYPGAAAGVVRGLFYRDGVLNGALYAVRGTAVYSITSAGVATALSGAVATATTRVKFEGDSDEVMILSGTSLYRYGGSSVAAVTAYSDTGSLPAIYDIAYIDGYYLYLLAGGTMAWSAVDDGDSIASTAYAVAASMPDGGRGILVEGANIWIGGVESMELFYLTGNSSSLFERRIGAVYPYGWASRDCAVRADNAFFFVSHEDQVIRWGGGPERVSTDGIEEEIAACTDKTAIEAWTYTTAGHLFVGFDIPGRGTFVYDAGSRVWVERRTWNETLYRAKSLTRAFDKILVGDRTDGKIYYLDATAYGEPNGDPVEREATALLRDIPERTPMDNIVIYGRMGVGNASVPDPSVMLDISRDGGNTYGVLHTRSLGAVGEYTNRVRFNRMGRVKSQGAVVRVRITDAAAARLDSLGVNEP